MSHATMQRCSDPACPAAAGASDRRPGLAAGSGRRALRGLVARPRRSGPTATAAEGPAGMNDRSSRPHHQPNRTPAPVVRKIVHLRWKQRLGRSRSPTGSGMAASTVHAVLVRCRINRLSHIDRATGEPIRRYEHDHPGDLIHVDVKKLGNIPDGGGWRYVGRQQGEKNRQPRPTHRRNAQQASQPADRDLRTSTPSSTTTPAWPTPRSTTTRPRRPRPRSCADAVAWFADRGVTVAAGPHRQRQLPTESTSGATPAPSWASRPRRTRPYRPQTNGKICEDLPLALHLARSDPGQGMTTVSCVRFVGRLRCSAAARTGQTELT